MADVRKDSYVLRPDQHAWPLVWRSDRPVERLPAITTARLVEMLGEKGARLRTWGHDDIGVHYIGVRHGTPLHIDPKYARYSAQYILRNDGWWLHGMEERVGEPPIGPGAYYCLDTHSPHKVTRDPRLGDGPFWLAIVIDSDNVPDPEAAWPLIEWRLLNDAHA